MRLGLELALSWLPFHPARLFAGGRQGSWYDPSDLSTLWQDSAGTTPVTADGDPVGRIDDKSGNGNHATQTVAGSRPTYKTAGGLHWLEYDGSDDALFIPAITYGGPLTVCLGLQRFASAVLGTFRSPKTLPPYIGAGLSYQPDLSTVTNSAGGTDRLDGVTFAGTRQDLYNALQTPRVGTAFGNTNSALHAEGTFFCYGPFRPSGKVFGYVEWEDASLAEVGRTERWIAARSGITL